MVKRGRIFLIKPIKLTMKAPFTVIKPFKQRSKSAITQNMFHDPNHVQEAAASTRENIEHFDFVGSQEFRTKLMAKQRPALKLEGKGVEETTALNETSPFNQTGMSKNMFNTTINRNTMLDSLHKEQQISFGKQTRNIERFKEYQVSWEHKKGLIQNSTKKDCVLMETNTKTLYVHPNEDKIDTINHYIMHHWEMSLRNNNPILERHIKGHRFGKVEKEKLLQFREGTRRVEASIPRLPIQQLNQLRPRELSLSGRNKVKREGEAEGMQNQTRYSVPTTGRVSQEQVLKIDYDGDKKWMGTENL